MASNTYSMRTLNDNWLEDRCQPPVTGDLHKLKVRKLETEIAYIGERYDVLGRIGRLHGRATYATPDDGFRETISTNLHDLRDPKSHSMFVGRALSTPALVNPANAPVCPPEMRELDGPLTGFGGSLQRHPKNHDVRFWNTTHGDVYGEGTRQRTIKLCPTTKHPSGVTSEAEEKRVTGMSCGSLCGEYYRETSDPARDTRTQRAWMPAGDPGVRSVHMGGKKPVAPSVDNELSLPMGDGAMSKVRQDLKDRQGRLSRVATHITKGAHLKAGLSLFQDD
mmetsp:Transcript_63490/g.182267  ORF Transcript_63490/g.182267 Transcript_63490/m.182267 type:complete len:279 (-) Transcript_63490:132-968(-)|eukprot:CAMPEP_0177219254 /NCGR_PEP_ID=MMETSP0367-20130122/36255_1 /TAXON_ID=447022 ORGANISM="Scrippsiella hangoei-like, Strain SHHI-4" /NCGR_SAMPLE_ID=MMETSP0367 /ASSEMBLY_ACC=CAM_ASM_000362 /LENGTH=278 /DNA_ID=CAMNT_0018668949 /DNA_START=107 /DNA_END=943 /DNA_ORIENTATION=+